MGIVSFINSGIILDLVWFGHQCMPCSVISQYWKICVDPKIHSDNRYILFLKPYMIHVTYTKKKTANGCEYISCFNAACTTIASERGL